MEDGFTLGVQCPSTGQLSIAEGLTSFKWHRSRPKGHRRAWLLCHDGDHGFDGAKHQGRPGHTCHPPQLRAEADRGQSGRHWCRCAEDGSVGGISEPGVQTLTMQLFWRHRYASDSGDDRHGVEGCDEISDSIFGD